MFNKRGLKELRLQSLRLYRDILKVIKRLDSGHQKTWYDYTRLKYQENCNISDENKIQKILNTAKEELDWMNSVLQRKTKL